jgi:cysteine desulfuration protein SufE
MQGTERQRFSNESKAVAEDLTIDDLYEEFEDLADWDERCDYLIDLGFNLPQLPEDVRTDEHKVHGCQSNVWLVAEMKPTEPPTLEFIANSDAIIVNGLIAVLMALYSNQTPERVLEINAQEVFKRLGLERHLSPQRRNGLYSMVDRVRQLAVEAAAKSS